MISQPMNGKTNEEVREERKILVNELTEQGYEVVDTVISDNAPKNCDEAIYYLSKSIEFISKVDAIIFMNGWEKARGCKIEYEVAKSYNKFIKFI